MIRNNTSFPIQITNKLKELHIVYNADNTWKNLLAYYQYIVKNIISNENMEILDSRGLLIYFVMGLGKTRTAVSVALSVINRPIIAIIPKSLQKNFADTVKYVEKELQINASNKINYVSLDAYNSFNQLDRLNCGLNNSLVIIDEAHNLFKAIINGSQDSNAYKIYEAILHAKNIKLLFLTGTPISKDPFELVPCVNMLAGTDLLPIYYDHFNSLYIDYVNKTLIHREYLANRLLGLVSYMSISEAMQYKFPKELPTIVERVEMSKMQYQKYLLIREKEEQNKSKILQRANIKAMNIPKHGSMSKYYVESRSASNFVYSTNLGSVTVDNSPKMALIADRVTNCKGLSLIYSQFVNTHGLKQVVIFLEKKGFTEYVSKNHSDGPKYILYTGETESKAREELIKTFNSEENKYGSIIKTILISKTGAEGLDLKNIRETHQLEPYWDYARNDQVKSRAIRYESHMTLPEEDRTVQPYIYLSIANKDMYDQIRNAKYKETQTIDELFYERSLNKKIINDQINKLLQDVSIECSYFNTANCYVCNPTNEPLFTSNPTLDIKIPNPCIAYKEEEKIANEIKIGDDVYFYTENPFVVYQFDTLLNGYVAINSDIKLIETIRKLITDNIATEK